MIRLPEGFPATRAGPRLPPFRAASRESSRRPDWANPAPWHALQRCSRMAVARVAASVLCASKTGEAETIPKISNFIAMPPVYCGFSGATVRIEAAELSAYDVEH